MERAWLETAQRRYRELAEGKVKGVPGPLETAKPVRKPGYLKGKLRIAADFIAALPERTIRDFEGR